VAGTITSFARCIYPCILNPCSFPVEEPSAPLTGALSGGLGWAEGRGRPCMDYEEIHEWLDHLDDAMAELAAATEKHVDVGHFAHVGWIVYELDDGDDLAHVLRVPPPVVRIFKSFGGRVALKDARILVDRLRSHVKSLGQVGPSSKETPDERLVVVERPTVSFDAVEWRSVPRTRDVKDKIAEISRLLDDIIGGVKRSNNSPDSRYLSDVERQQLIAVLETTLAILRAPVVEKGLFLKARDMLQKASVKAEERAAEKIGELGAGVAMGWMLDRGVALLSELISRCF
jgi:hypothetical protein